MQEQIILNLKIDSTPIRFGNSPHFTLITALEGQRPLLSLYLSYTSLSHYDSFIRKTLSPFDLETFPEPPCINIFCLLKKFKTKIEYYLNDLIPNCQIRSISRFLQVFGLDSLTPPGIFYEEIFRKLRTEWLRNRFGKENSQECKENVSKMQTAFIVVNFKGLEFKFYKYGQVGSGAFGFVELVGVEPNNKTDAKYCLKFFVFPSDEEKREKMVDQLQHEIAALATLSHANLVDFIEAFVKRDAHKKIQNICLLMHYCNQGNLHDFVHKYGVLDEKTALDFLAQLIEGLQYLHRARSYRKASFLHGDLKPKNILLHCPDEKRPEVLIVKLADFGCSRRVLKAEFYFKKQIGTKSFRAPQILKDEKYTDKCDIWSLGIVLYFMLAGTTPWGSEEVTEYQILGLLTSQKSLEKIIDEKFKGSQISKETLNLMKKMLQINEIDRIGWTELSKNCHFNFAEHLKESQSHINPIRLEDSYQLSRTLLSVQTIEKRHSSIPGFVVSNQLNLNQAPQNNLQMIEEFQSSENEIRDFGDLNIMIHTESFEENNEANEEQKNPTPKKTFQIDRPSEKWVNFTEDDPVGAEKEISQKLIRVQIDQRLKESLDQSLRVSRFMSNIDKMKELLGVELTLLEALQILLRKLGISVILYNIQEMDQYRFWFCQSSDLLEWRRKSCDALAEFKSEGENIKKVLLNKILNMVNNPHLYRNKPFLGKFKLDERFIEEILSDCIKDKAFFSDTLQKVFSELIETIRENIQKANINRDLMSEGYSKEKKTAELRKMLGFYESMIVIMSYGGVVEKSIEELGSTISLGGKMVELGLVSSNN